MRAYISTVLSFFVCMLSYAAGFDVDGLHYVVLPDEGNQVEVSLPSGSTMSTIVIPSSVENEGITYTVTTIAERGFNNVNIHSLTIPPTITLIKSTAFKWCNNLKTINISDLSSWCRINFYDDGSNPVIKARCLYINGNELTKLVIPEDITRINAGTFYGCNSLRSVVVPDHVTYIGIRAFDACTNLESIQIGNNVETIEHRAFADCRSLQELRIPKSVSLIGTELLWQTSLSSIIVDSENPYYDSREDCNAIIYTPTDILISGCKNTVIPDGVKRIEDKAFFGNPDLTSIVVPSSVESIGMMAFDGCRNLRSVTLPNLKSIGFFGSLSSIQDVNMMFKDNEDFLNYITREDLHFVFYQQSLDRQPHRLFINGELLTEVNLPSSVTKIPSDAFRLCTDIKSATFSESITEIGTMAFDGCTGLETISIPPSLSQVRYNAFNGCTGLKAVNISNLKAWCNISFDSGDSAYESSANPLYHAHSLYLNGEKVDNLVIPEDVEAISNSSFIGADITSLTINNTVSSVGHGAFKSCGNLKQINFGHSLKTIGKYSFDNCPSLTSVIIPESVTTIKEDAFGYCKNLNYLDIGDGVETIGSSAFYLCSNLKNIKLGRSLKSLEQTVFFLACKVDAVICTAPVPPTFMTAMFINAKNTILYVPENLVATYKAHYFGTQFKDVLPLDESDIKIPTFDGDVQNYKFFNTNGSRISSLQHGINIVNGKKILVK